MKSPATHGELSVLHVATTDLGDGAGIAAFRLHQALRHLDIQSRMAVINKRSNHPDVHEVRRRFASSKIFDFSCDGLAVLLNQILPQNAFSSHSRSLLSSPLVKQSSVFNLHALHKRRRHFAADLCRSLAQHAPVVWTLHDMWAFTGHCTYAFDCERWKDACGTCPALGDPVKLAFDTTAMNLGFKKWIYARSDFAIVTPSKWLADLAGSSPLLADKRIVHIPNGIDTNVFLPVDKRLAREQLSLPQDGRILVCTSSQLADRRKGLHLVWEALSRPLRLEKCILLMMGDGVAQDIPHGWSVRKLGYISDPAKQAVVYSAADALIFPSLADNLPNMVIEAMACGAAVLTFAVGGIPEIVHSGETGYLAPLGDVEALRRGLEWLFEDEERLRRMQRAAAAHIAQVYAPHLQAERYRDLYLQLIEARQR